eukprot:g15357.t1
MWEIRVDSSDSADFTCEKCTQLQLLKACIKELELELNEHRIIPEAEVVTETSYKDIVTPKNESSWVTVRKAKGRKQSVQGSPVVIPLNNKYTVVGDDLPG